jgi:hypothetical protein
VTTSNEAQVELSVDFLDATSPPPNTTCAAPLPITPETPLAVSILDTTPALPTACATTVGQLTYSFTLTAAADVRVFGTTTRGSGAPVLSLRSAQCTDKTDEIRCRPTTSLPLFVRNLQPGTYELAVGATSTIDASILLRTYAPTVAPPPESCATAPALAPNTRVGVDLSNSEGALDDGCFSAGAPNAAYDLSLANASDVLVVGRFPQLEAGAVAIAPPTCAPLGDLVCTVSGTPARASKRNIPAGDLRVLVFDQIGAQNTSVTAYVRDTVPPANVTGRAGCPDVIDIPPTGGYFTGDTSAANANFDDSCDAPTPTGGAPDQVLRLVLAQAQHVVFDMSGSSYTTILDIRQGDTCPGAEVTGDCYVGFTGQRSFLDLELAAGTYWVVVDGYAAEHGPWNLDVRVLPP